MLGYPSGMWCRILSKPTANSAIILRGDLQFNNLGSNECSLTFHEDLLRYCVNVTFFEQRGIRNTNITYCFACQYILMIFSLNAIKWILIKKKQRKEHWSRRFEYNDWKLNLCLLLSGVNFPKGIFWSWCNQQSNKLW